MAGAAPHHRHQSSLEAVIDFSTNTPLNNEQRDSLKARFYHVIEYFEPTTTSNPKSKSRRPYDPTKLIRFTYEYALSDESRDNFLRAFFRSMSLPIDENTTWNDDHEQLRSDFLGFADYLIDNFFLPLKASAKKTPQPSPVYHSAVRSTQGEHDAQEFVGTQDRLSALRGECLVRDRHRCVISRSYDRGEAAKRHKASGRDARDDDGELLAERTNRFHVLEVAHILPHSLMKSAAGTPLDSSREAAISILNMFDSGIRHLIEGPDIDRPRNAITLTQDLHQSFGNFDIFFEPLAEPHTYRIDSFLPQFLFQDPTFPITRTLYLTDDRNIDPPSPRLLAVHRAIAHILHLSAAGDYIDSLLEDIEETGVREDGSTELDRLVALGLRGWGSPGVLG